MAVAVQLTQPRWADMQVLLEYLNHVGDQVRSVRLLPQCLAAAEGFLDDHCRRQWRPEPYALTDPPVAKTLRLRPRQWRVHIPDCRALQSVTIGGLPVSEGGLGYELNDALSSDGTEWPADMLRLYRGAYSQPVVGRTAVVMTGWWGWNPIPPSIVDGVYRLAARIVHEQKAAYSDAVLLPEGGVMQYYKQLPSTVQAAVDYYQRQLVGSATAAG